MSFRLFVYYCALFGGWAGFVGWILGRLFAPSEGALGQGVRALMTGLVVALVLSLVDSVFNLGTRRMGLVLVRVLVAIGVGVFGGFLGGLLGYSMTGISELIGFVIGWTFVGMLSGAAIGAFEVTTSAVSGQNFSGSLKKFMKSFIGGTIGGFIGGLAAYFIRGIIASIFPTKDINWLWSPSSIGFVILGMCIGLLVGLAQVILKEAWVRVEAGFRPGRELILTKDKTSVGRAEGSDIPLFGDQGVEKLHSLIVNQSGRYYLEDNQTPGGVFVNDQRVNGKVALNSGDLIRMGTRSLLRFYEKAKR